MLLEITYIEEVHDPKYRVLTDGSYVIGGARCNIPLADCTVAPLHARVTIGGGKITIEDLGSATGTFVDDVVIEGPTEVEPGQPIRIGDTLLRITLGDNLPVKNYDETRTPSQIENDFLTALHTKPADDGIRLVYADWLEAEGHRFAAHYIRAELANEVDVETSETLGKAVYGTTSAEWRVLIRRDRIGGCRVAGCPKFWHLLEPLPKIFERTCAVCHERVVYCCSVDDVGAAGETRTRVVFDAVIWRVSAADAYYRGRFHWDPNRTLDAHAHARLFGELEDDFGDEVT